jgi:hypothetical protein
MHETSLDRSSTEICGAYKLYCLKPVAICRKPNLKSKRNICRLRGGQMEQNQAGIGAALDVNDENKVVSLV